MGYSDISTRKAPLSRHPALMPLIAAWLAALLGGSMAVLPAGMINAGLAQAPFALPAFAASQIAIAGLAAILGAGLGWAAARAVYAVQHRPEKSASAIEHAVSDTEESEVVEAEVIEAEVIEAEVFEDHVTVQEQVADDIAPVPQPYDDAPFYADVGLSELLGAPRVEDAEQNETAILSGMAMGQMPVMEPEQETKPETTPPPVSTQPQAKLPQHGKAVNLLRAHDTRKLAMPQLIERFAVALDDQRRLAENAAHSYSPPLPPASLTQRLRALVGDAQPAE